MKESKVVEDVVGQAAARAWDVRVRCGHLVQRVWPKTGFMRAFVVVILVGLAATLIGLLGAHGQIDSSAPHEVSCNGPEHIPGARVMRIVVLSSPTQWAFVKPDGSWPSIFDDVWFDTPPPC